MLFPSGSKSWIGTIPSGSKSWIGKSLTIHESENNPTRGRRPSVGLFSLEWRVMDFPIQLFEPDGNSIPIELMRFYYITTWFSSKVWNWSIPHFCKTYGIGQFHTFDENWISFKKSVKSQHFFPKVWNWPIPHFLRKVWNWSIPHFWEIFSCFPYVLTSKPSILQRRVRGGSGGFISTLWFWILLPKMCEIEIIWKW